MIIKLNDKDIHGAIRGFLQQQNQLLMQFHFLSQNIQ